MPQLPGVHGALSTRRLCLQRARDPRVEGLPSQYSGTGINNSALEVREWPLWARRGAGWEGDRQSDRGPSPQDLGLAGRGGCRGSVCSAWHLPHPGRSLHA